MVKFEAILLKTARSLGYRSSLSHWSDLADWLREEKQIHVEVSSIWDDLNNKVESYCYTITFPVNVYYCFPVYASGGLVYKEMMLQGIAEALKLLKKYNEQKHLKVTDDQVIIAYLKGYGDKNLPGNKSIFQSNMEKYAYQLGKQGDYIAEGLTEDDILILVRNQETKEENLKLN